MRVTTKILTVAAGVAFVLGGSNALAINGARVFSGFYFSPTNGRVGYHMIARNFFQQVPCNKPPEFIHVSDMTVSGTVPPGISPPGMATGLLNFEGTPRQPGDWQVTVTVHNISCSMNPHTPGPVDYGDLTTTVNFHIDP